MAPEQIIEALNGMSKTPEGQKQVEAYMQQFQQEMQNPQAGMFKEGGKLHDFICKHAKGGHVAGCGCKEDGGKVKKAQYGGFALDDPNNKIVQSTTRRNPDGAVSKVTTIANSIGDAARQTITGNDTLSVGGYFMDNKFMPEGDITFNNQELEAAIKKIRMNQPSVQTEQEGGNISRNQALSVLMSDKNFTRAQARTAYANVKNGLRKQGLRGNTLRQRARQIIMGQSTPTEERPAVEAISAAPISAAVTGPAVSIVGAPRAVTNYDNMTFGNAFRAARNIASNGGSKTFNWRGKTYGTNLASSPKLPVISDDVEIEIPEVNVDLPTVEETPINVSLIGTTPTQTSAAPRYTRAYDEIPTYVGTGLMPAGSMESLMARSIPDDSWVMPSLTYGRWDAQKKTPVKADSRKGQVSRNQKGGNIISYYRNKLNNDFFA